MVSHNQIPNIRLSYNSWEFNFELWRCQPEKDFVIIILMIHFFVPVAWWRHQMETFSALLAICAGNSPFTDELPTQRPLTRSFGVTFHLRLNKRLSKQSWGWWFETPSGLLWRHCNELIDLPRTQANHAMRADIILPTRLNLGVFSLSQTHNFWKVYAIYSYDPLCLWCMLIRQKLLVG